MAIPIYIYIYISFVFISAGALLLHHHSAPLMACSDFLMTLMVRGQKPLALYNVIQSLIINHDSFLLFFKQKFIAFDYGDGLPPEECSPRDFCSNFLPLHIIAGFLKNVLVIFELALQMEQDGGNLYI